MMRRKTKELTIGKLKLGGNNPIWIQSMAKTDTRDVKNTVAQINELKKAGCEIIRVAVKDIEAAKAIKDIKKEIELPLEVDIHFHYKLALESMSCGADAVRLNPGNIHKRDEIEAVVNMAKERKIPIRVGVNSGSINKGFPSTQPSPQGGEGMDEGGDIGVKHSSLNIGEQMVKSAMDYIKVLEDLEFFDIMVSLKASDVSNTVDAYRKMAKLVDYPFHLGVTATGLPRGGIVKSAIGIGALLLDGIGDTLRVSLAGDPKEEIEVGREILSSLGLRRFHPEVIACPTCGRCEIDVIKIAKEVEDRLLQISDTDSAIVSDIKPLKVAIMGCVVNGPGESMDADIGLAGGKGIGVIFHNGRVVKKVRESEMVEELIKVITSKKTY